MSFEQAPNQNNENTLEENSMQKKSEGFGSFEEQFSNRLKIELVGATAEVVDLKPENAKTEIPTVLAPGWACNLEVYKPVLREIFKTDRRVISMEHPRLSDEQGDVEAAIHRANVDERALFDYPKAELRKALNLIQMLDQMEIPKADMIAHSESAISVTIAATLRPEKFNNIVFYGPAGLVGEDSLSRLAVGFSGQSKRPESMKDIPVSDEEKQSGKEVMKSLFTYFFKNPLRALNEILDLSETEIDKMLKNLHDQGKGLFIMSGIDDPVFPNSQMEKFVRKDIIDGFMTVQKAGHGLPETSAPAIDQIFIGLEELKKKTKNEL